LQFYSSYKFTVIPLGELLTIAAWDIKLYSVLIKQYCFPAGHSSIYTLIFTFFTELGFFNLGTYKV